MEAPKLRVNRWDKHKLCPTHGTRYLLIQDFNHPSQTGMCAHPECVEKMLSSLQTNRMCGGLIKFCRKLDKDRGENDFAVYVIMTLLEGAKKGKPTVPNPFHMKWACLNYLAKLRKEEVRIERQREILQQIGQILEFEAEEYIENVGLGMFVTGKSKNIDQKNPEKALAYKEIIQLTIEEWGVETYLWMFDELSDLDYMKVTQKTPKELKEIRTEWRKWYNKVTNAVFCK